MGRLISKTQLICIVTTLSLFSLLGCQDQKGPEGALKSFVEYRFTKDQDLQELINKTSGDLKARIQGMPTEDLEDYLNNSEYKMKSFEVNHKTCEKNTEKCFVTYTIRYDQMRGEETFFEAEIKKIAEMRQEANSWKVADVSNLKTYYDSKKAIETDQKSK